MNVLVIDDNEFVRRALHAVLTRFGHEVAIASSGQEGLRLAQETFFDAILCDLEMPGMSGDEVHARLSENQRKHFVLHTSAVWAERDFGARMRVISKMGSPAEIRDVLELARRGE